MTLEPLLLLAFVFLLPLFFHRDKRRRERFEQEKRHKRYLMGLRDKNEG